MSTITIYLDKCKVQKLNAISYSVILEVDYDYSFDPGVWRDRNGEGYPPSEEIEIGNIKCTGDLMDLLLNYSRTQDVIDEIEVKISEYEHDK